ncbi:hypothetical protein CDD82_2151 [Ophiocordyceps australis]|uniref:Uncharacterized protein n=1 Tax=Ophiocordyceps australis TaxID=1399860 RepID=A0A2C5Y384_9HYPO|nr:hypothetical protein CDD82_2151 [Ophiocordyceps australis]
MPPPLTPTSQPPQPSPALGFYIALHDCSLVVTLRSLEPANASLHIGTKLGLAIGTVRRLEHDEMDRLFPYRPDGDGSTQCRHNGPTHPPDAAPDVQQVYVREKVRVESADPSLISLDSKLGYLSHMLAQARRNLSLVMGNDVDD